MRILSIAIAILLAVSIPISTAQVRPDHEKPAVAPDPGQITAAEALRRDMRQLWSDHVFWTREYVIAAVANQPDAKAAAARLLRNQDDIGQAVATFYGKPAGDQLTALLRQHILIAVDLIEAAKAHDQTKFAALDLKWARNGEEIGDFLAKANPNWPRATLAGMMKMHLATTKTEVTARLNGDWDGDVKAFDAVNDHILKMSDALADGIIKQFPERFSVVTSQRSGLK